MREFTKQGRLEEIRSEKNLHKGMLFSLLLITVFYVIVSIIMMASVDGEWWLNKDGSPEGPIFAFFDAVVSTK